MLPSAITRRPQGFSTVNTDTCYFKKQIKLYVVGQLLLAGTHCCYKWISLEQAQSCQITTKLLGLRSAF